MTTKPAQSDAPSAERFLFDSKAYVLMHESVMYYAKHHVIELLEAYAALRTAQLREQLNTAWEKHDVFAAKVAQLAAHLQEKSDMILRIGENAQKSEAKVAQLERERDALLALEKHLPDGYAIGDDASAELALKLVAAESALSEARERTIQECAKYLEACATMTHSALTKRTLEIAAQDLRLLTSSASAKGE